MTDKDKKYWRSLGSLKKSPDYRKQLHKEHHTQKSEDVNNYSRRSFLGIMGASMAMAGLAGCRKPVEKIIPYVKQPEEIIPGVAQYYATTMPFGNSAYGLLIESHEGRPTKIEGNANHPSSLGASNIFMQSAILNLYDPDRSGKVLLDGNEKEYDDFTVFWTEQFEKYSNNKGEKFAVISESYNSPTMARLKKEFDKKYPKATWVAYEPISDEASISSIKNLSGKDLKPSYHYDKADLIVSFDADFMQNENDSVLATKGFTKGRTLSSPDDKMNRLYQIESGFSVTGASADHRLKLQSSKIGQFALALSDELVRRGLKLDLPEQRSNDSFDKKWIEAIADDLLANKEKSIVIAGKSQPQWLHEVVLLINEALDNIDKTITFRETKFSLSPNLNEFNKLISKIDSGNIDTLLIIGGNPAYNAPSDFNFESLLKKVKNTIHLSEYNDETSKLTSWHIPRANFLESWGDAASSDNTLSIIQPLIAPLYNGIGDVDFVSLITTGISTNGYDVVRETWKDIIKGDFEKGWRKTLHDGIYDSNKDDTVRPKLNKSRLSNISNTSSPSDKLEVVFRDSLLFDGRYANNGWLQELPDPITKLVWDNAAIVSTKTANDYNLENGDIITLTVSGNKTDIPIWIIPGFADYSIGLTLGYGRKEIGRIADNVGFNTYPLRKSDNLYVNNDVQIVKIGQKHTMSNTQDANRMEGRAIVREASLDEYKQNPEFAKEMVEHPPLESLFPDFDYSKGYQWGMVIDLTSCIGCGACTIACQSENNIPIVGKEQVGKGRELHWMRNDRYFTGEEDNPEIVVMPVTCQHCENAPCEQVCPVAATTHDEEGINNMTYNRCIGTRYCSNNCPYKVRKFNFFNYTNELPEVVKMAQNPDVTVRSRGVMEKCTFCIQRIKKEKLSAKKENRVIKDGDFMSACQQACPASAIQFGNINDPESIVTSLKKIDRNYELLGELNVRPRNSYLAKVRNYNKKLIPDKKETVKH